MILYKPFEEKEILPVPQNWQVGPPNFVGVASGKAGTSWWYQCIAEHPSVKANRLNRKELVYFNHFTYHGIKSHDIKKYNRAFAAPPGCVCGEWSPSYLNHPLSINYLAKAAPKAKILALIRNPIDRVLSALNQQLSRRVKYYNLSGDNLYIYKTFALFPDIFNYSLLHFPFAQLLKFFNRSQILLLQYEKCKMSPDEEIKKTYRFLNIDDNFSPPSLKKPVNKKPYLIPSLDAKSRKLLSEYFYEDTRLFQDYFPEIDLSLWEDFVN